MLGGLRSVEWTLICSGPTENKRAGERRRLIAYCVVNEDCYYCVLTILSSAVRATSAESLLSMPIDFTSLHVPLT